jgi:hypothetical protein
MLLAVAYWLVPVAFAVWLYYELQSGALPPETDAIGIPIAGFTFVWFVIFPISIVFLFVVESLIRKSNSAEDRD